MSGFIDYLPEVFELFGSIDTRRMFGGYGVYHHGLMFGLVADDTLYLKTDAGNLQFFVAEGLGPFAFTSKDGRTTKMSYYRAPDEILDDRELAKTWGQRAFDAALRAQAAKKPAPAKPSRTTKRKSP